MAWYDALAEAGLTPTLWLVIAYVVTFAATRWITRRIRARQDAGGGVISDIHIGGVHIHHQVWGILLVLIVGLLEFRYQPGSPWVEVLAALFGAGAALALDEFALWLHLEDVYWSPEGRKSIDAIVVAGVIALALLVGASPLGIAQEPGMSDWVYVTALAVHFLWVFLAFLKGKRTLGLIGIVVPLVAFVAALRLAKPTSFWARRRYGERKMARALSRFGEEYQRRWNRLRDRIGGAPGGRIEGAVDRIVTRSIQEATGDDAPAGGPGKTSAE